MGRYRTGSRSRGMRETGSTVELKPSTRMAGAIHAARQQPPRRPDHNGGYGGNAVTGWEGQGYPNEGPRFGYTRNFGQGAYAEVDVRMVDAEDGMSFQFETTGVMRHSSGESTPFKTQRYGNLIDAEKRAVILMKDINKIYED